MSDPRTTAQILVSTEDNLNRSRDEIAVLRLALEDAKECSRVLGAEVDRLRAEKAEFDKLKAYAASLGQETYLELHAENVRLRASIASLAFKVEAENDRLRSRVEELEMEISLCSGGCTLTCSHANAAKAANEAEPT